MMILKHIITLLLSGLLAHFIINMVRKGHLTNFDYLTILFLTVLLYSVFINFQANFYLEYFDINPNIVEINTNHYQEENVAPSPVSPADDKNIANVNIYIDGTKVKTKSSLPLTKPDQEQKATSLQKAPSILPFLYDDGSASSPLSSDTNSDLLMKHLRSNIAQELIKNYPQTRDVTALRALIASKMHSRMPYISNTIRQDVIDNLDSIIDEELDKITGSTLLPTTGATTTGADVIQSVPPHTHIAPLRYSYSNFVAPDGSTQTTYKDGSVHYTLPDGSIHHVYPDGSSRHKYPDGTITATANKVTTPLAYAPETMSSLPYKPYYTAPRDAYADVDKAWAYEATSAPWGTYIENMSNGMKMSTARLFDPAKPYTLSTELHLPKTM